MSSPLRLGAAPEVPARPRDGIVAGFQLGSPKTSRIRDGVDIHAPPTHEKHHAMIEEAILLTSPPKLPAPKRRADRTGSRLWGSSIRVMRRRSGAETLVQIMNLVAFRHPRDAATGRSIAAPHPRELIWRGHVCEQKMPVFGVERALFAVRRVWPPVDPH